MFCEENGGYKQEGSLHPSSNKRILLRQFSCHLNRKTVGPLSDSHITPINGPK